MCERLAEGVGFEPTRPFWGLTVFKTAAIGHSATPPCNKNGTFRKTRCTFAAHFDTILACNEGTFSNLTVLGSSDTGRHPKKNRNASA
jgi:hypothetical protein